jgi:hypothetical protein
MADPELVKTLDYILNRCDEGAIEAVAAAVVRRKRDLALFGGVGRLPDPQKMAKELASQIDAKAIIGGLAGTVRNMAERIIRQEAPELDDGQVEELLDAWTPDAEGRRVPARSAVPASVLRAMIGQFTAYSWGTLDPAEEQGLRSELGVWPDRYWKAFPRGIQLIISGYLREEMDEKEFNARIGAALSPGK